MSRKTLIMIVVFGLGALVLLGMGMQFALKSSPGLQESIRFKQALARDFATRGIQEVALRNLERPGHYHLLLTGAIPASEVDRERLDEEIADYFVRTHGDTRAQLLRVSYHMPPTWGCSAALAEPHRVQEIPLPPIRRRIARIERQTALATHLEGLGCRVLSCELVGDSTIELRVQTAVTDPAEATSLARRIERDARSRLRGFYSTLRLVVLGEPRPEKDENGKTVLRDNVLFDAGYDRRGSKARSGASSSRAGAGAGAATNRR